MFVLRRVAPGRFVHLGGKGRGEGWAGIVEASLDEDLAVAEALKTNKPVRIAREGYERIFGPYYARSAAIVPVSQDAVVIYGSPDGVVDADDEALTSAAAEITSVTEPAGETKQMADELELLEAVRAAVSVGVSPVPGAMEELARVAAEALSCELGIIYLVEGDRIAVAERGWELRVTPEEAAASLRALVGQGAFPFCVQDAHTAPPPGALAKDKGIRSYYLLELTGLARGVLMVAHTDAAPRGFTLLCRRLGARVAEVASSVLGVGITREWTGEESARLQTGFADLP